MKKKNEMTVSEFARLGGLARAGKMSKAERQTNALKAINARWAKFKGKGKTE